MKEKLQSIIEQKVTGENAVKILISAKKELSEATTQYIELGQLIRQAENIIIYGEGGIHGHETLG